MALRNWQQTTGFRNELYKIYLRKSEPYGELVIKPILEGTSDYGFRVEVKMKGKYWQWIVTTQKEAILQANKFMRRH
jgi:hypothetical protein